MSELTLRDINSVRRVVREARSAIRPSKALERLLREHGIGRETLTGWHLRAGDRKALRQLVEDIEGVDPLKVSSELSRTDMASLGATNEKRGRRRPLASRVVCTALPGPIPYAGGLLNILPGVEFRIEVNGIDIKALDAVLCIENHEAFLDAHRLNWVPPGNTLVVYRGHDASAIATQEILTKFAEAGKMVIFSADADPAGIQMTLSSAATHALVPDLSWRASVTSPGNQPRALDQLNQLPRLRDSIIADDALSDAYREYALWLLTDCRAYTEEAMIGMSVCLALIPVHLGKY